MGEGWLATTTKVALKSTGTALKYIGDGEDVGSAFGTGLIVNAATPSNYAHLFKHGKGGLVGSSLATYGDVIFDAIGVLLASVRLYVTPPPVSVGADHVSVTPLEPVVGVCSEVVADGAVYATFGVLKYILAELMAFALFVATR